jgi:ribosomal protein S18 acetylase RimI-like enzyme
MYLYKTLENTRIEVLHKAFVDAFSDYQIKMDLPMWKFQAMLQRRGFAPSISVGAFQGELLVGFVLNGYRDWNGKSTVYDLGTGVIGEYRKQGITSNILSYLKDLLKEKGIEQYLLEVLQTNTAAFQLYEKQGFEVVRAFSCFQIDKNLYLPRVTYKIESVDRINEVEWENLESFWDYMPSWQNSADSVNALAEAFSYSVVIIDGSIAGYGMIDKRTGDIAQIAVDRRYRRRGVARSIITALIDNTEGERISVLNVDGRDVGMKSFLLDAGFINTVDQYEMLLRL